MLHPNQFTVNDAWIVFRINDAPIETDADGAFNCLALMDAASCFILGSEFIAADQNDPTELEFRRLLKQGENHKQQLPKSLLITCEQARHSIAQVAKQQGIQLIEVLESELDVFIGEARDGFREQFGRSEA